MTFNLPWQIGARKIREAVGQTDTHKRNRLRGLVDLMPMRRQRAQLIQCARFSLSVAVTLRCIPVYSDCAQVPIEGD